MEGKSIVGLLIILVFIAYLIPVGMDAFSTGRDRAANESEQLAYYNTLSASDQANFTSDYAEDGEPPTPWAGAEYTLFSIMGLLAIIAVVRGIGRD